MFDAKRPIHLLAPVALAALLVVGLSACEDPPPEPGTPVLQIHGTKPPSIDFSLRIRYEATTEQRQCQKFTMRTIGYVPIEPLWHVWPYKPTFKKPDRRYRVVPMDTTGTLPDSLKEKGMEAFRWTINAGWTGKPRGCDFNLIGFSFFNIYKKELSSKLNEIGDFSIGLENCEENYSNRVENLIRLEIECKIEKNGNKCTPKKDRYINYCTGKSLKDTIKIYMNVGKPIRK